MAKRNIARLMGAVEDTPPIADTPPVADTAPIADTAPSKKAPASPKRPKRYKESVYLSDEDRQHITRLSVLLIGAGVDPSRIEKSKVIRLALQVARTDGFSADEAVEAYNAMMDDDWRRNRQKRK